MLNALLLIGSAWAGEWQSLGVTNDEPSIETRRRNRTVRI